MYQWEYCYLKHTSQGLISVQCQTDGPTTHIYHPDATRSASDYFQTWQYAIAKLGLDGWEINTVITLDEIYDNLYFRRLIPKKRNLKPTQQEKT